MCPYDIGRDKSRPYKLFLNSSNPQFLKSSNPNYKTSPYKSK